LDIFWKIKNVQNPKTQKSLVKRKKFFEFFHFFNPTAYYGVVRKISNFAIFYFFEKVQKIFWTLWTFFIFDTLHIEVCQNKKKLFKNPEKIHLQNEGPKKHKKALDIFDTLRGEVCQDFSPHVFAYLP